MNRIWTIFVLAVFRYEEIWATSEICETAKCTAYSEDMAHRMWSMSILRENVFKVYSHQLARTRHFQLALWHLTEGSKLRAENSSSREQISNRTYFTEPDISQVYQKEIDLLVGDFAKSQPVGDFMREMGLEETQEVVDQLWAKICAGELAITQRLVASLLRRYHFYQNYEGKENLEHLIDLLHRKAIPPQHWQAEVAMSSRSLCDSNVCAWLETVVERAEPYMTLEKSGNVIGYMGRLAKDIRNYCEKQSYSVLDDLIGHNLDEGCNGEMSTEFEISNAEMMMIYPNPINNVGEITPKTARDVIKSDLNSNPFKEALSKLAEILNEVPYEHIKNKFANKNATNYDLIKFLLKHETVKGKLDEEEKLRNFTQAYMNMIEVANDYILDNMTITFENMYHLSRLLPVVDSEDELKDIEQLKSLLSDPEELRAIFAGDDLLEYKTKDDVLEALIRNLLMDTQSTKYNFTDGLYSILDKLVSEASENLGASHEVTGLDTLIVEVDPSRLDRKPRFAQPGGYYSQEYDRPRSTYTLQFTLPSPVLKADVYDRIHPEVLVPLESSMLNDSVDYDLMSEVRKLLADPAIANQIFSIDFNLEQYPTKISLLEYVLARFLILHDENDIEIDPVIEDFIELYHSIVSFTNEELGVAPKAVMRVNYADLLLLLPKPISDEEIGHYEAIQSLLLDDDHLDYLVKDMDSDLQMIQGDILNYILSKCSSFVEDEETRLACKYYSLNRPVDEGADKECELYVVYKKAKLEDLDALYVQLNPSYPQHFTVAADIQEPRRGIMQIPIANPNLPVEAGDLLHPSRMIPDVEISFEMFYNISNLKWQIRRDDVISEIFEEAFDWRHYNMKTKAIEEILDRLIALGLSGDVYMQNHTLDFAMNYVLALKAAFGNCPTNKELAGDPKYDYARLLDATKLLTDDKQFIEQCDYLKGILEDKALMKEVLGPNFHLGIFKNDVTLLRAVLYKMIHTNSEDLQRARDVSHEVLGFLQQLGHGYDIVLVTKEVQKEIDISDTLDAALDRKSLPREEWEHYKKALKFMISSLDIPIHLPNFEFQNFETKGELVEGMFSALIANKEVPEKIRVAMKSLLKYNKLDGRGAEKL